MNSHRFAHKAACILGVGMLCTAPLAIGQSSGQGAAGDKKFVVEALQGGTAEVQLGQLAQQKGSSDDVKQFGRSSAQRETRPCHSNE